jgi:hypothetical protein
MADDHREPADDDRTAGGGAGGSTGTFPEPAAAGRVPEFVRLPNGGSGAQAGTHDDLVMAMAIGLAARAELAGKKTQPLAPDF